MRQFIQGKMRHARQAVTLNQSTKIQTATVTKFFVYFCVCLSVTKSSILFPAHISAAAEKHPETAVNNTAARLLTLPKRSDQITPATGNL